jgi:DNA processing protein
MPAALFGRGDPGLLAGLDSEPAVTLVGARRASAYGRTVAGDLGRLLAAAGVTVVSGLAHGVDSAAHTGALEGHGGTIAVLGAGADRPYPAGQHRLYERIAARGLVLSELPPGARPYRWTFPARNRIMAALGAMTVVVEAASRSGSLITAEMSLDLGRELGAVPGPVNAWRHEGANQLLAEGARLVRGAQDALDVLYGPGVRRVVERGPELSSRTAAVLGQIEVGASSCDAIAAALGAPAGEVGAALTQLELFGYLSSDALGRYLRTALRAPEPPRDRSGDSRGAAGASLAAKRH